MPSIATVDAQGLYTKKLVATYAQLPMPTLFMNSFFTEVESTTKELSIEVQRAGEPIAVDVIRGTDGNRNQWERSTEKIFVPPFFKEWFDMTELQLYDRLFGATEITDAMFAQLINDSARKVVALRNKITRRIELNCAQVFDDGVVKLDAGVNIDYMRKATSKVDLGAGQYFADNIDPFAKFEAGCEFIRTEGLATGGTFNAIMGKQALTDLLANTKFNARQNLFNMALDQVTGPQRGASGQAFHGVITCGSYKVQLWTYPQVYKNAAGQKVPYWDPKKVCILPTETPDFVLGYAAVPQLLKPGSPVTTGKFIIREFTNEENAQHKVFVESAPLPIPVAIDQIYTFKAVA
jgi:hypothetical protein